jgi:hypothetical protein
VDPLRVILTGVRTVGEEGCWPASRCVEVIRALASLDRAVLGVELWRFEGGDAPEVVGWSEYSVATAGPWPGVVAAAARAAEESVLGHTGDLGLWMNLTWIERSEVGNG